MMGSITLNRSRILALVSAVIDRLTRWLPQACAVLLMSLTGSGPAAAQGPAGLVAAFGFDEGSGMATADSSGNANNGTATSAAWTTAGRFGSALVFNGNSTLVSVNDSAS